MQEPLLSPTAMAMHQQGFASKQSLTPSLPPSINYNVMREAPLHRPQDRSYSPSPAYTSVENFGSPVSPYPAGSEQSHTSYFGNVQPQQHHRSGSANMLNQQIRSASPGPNSAMQYPPQQQHTRQGSANMLARTPSPGPYQAYGGPQEHTRQPSGNVLQSGRTTSPGPYQAYGGQPQSARTASPGPYQAYPPQQHGRQMSGNMLAGSQQPPQQPTNMAGRGRPKY